MKIIVCIKQVPDTTEIRIDPVKGTLMRDGVPSILNPDDANALEAALQIKDEYPGTVVDVVTMGPQQASYALRECLAMGADDAYLLSSRAFGGADTCSTSTTLAYGIKKIGDYDFIFAGRQAIDGDTAQVGPQLAQRLGLPAGHLCAEHQRDPGEFRDPRTSVRGWLRSPGNSAAVRSHCGERTEPAEIYVCHRHRKSIRKGDYCLGRKGSRYPSAGLRPQRQPDKGIPQFHPAAEG